MSIVTRLRKLALEITGVAWPWEIPEATKKETKQKSIYFGAFHAPDPLLDIKVISMRKLFFIVS